MRIGNAFSSNYIEYKSNGDKGKIRPYLSHMINDHRTQRECKIKLTMTINFFSAKDSEETHIQEIIQKKIWACCFFCETKSRHAKGM